MISWNRPEASIELAVGLPTLWATLQCRRDELDAARRVSSIRAPFHNETAASEENREVKLL